MNDDMVTFDFELFNLQNQLLAGGRCSLVQIRKIIEDKLGDKAIESFNRKYKDKSIYFAGIRNYIKLGHINLWKLI